jgi:hypothetical protein
VKRIWGEVLCISTTFLLCCFCADLSFNLHSFDVSQESPGNYKYKIQIYNTTRKNCFRYLKLTSPLNAAICTTISYTLWVEWYYLKNNYLTLWSKVKVPRRSLWYATHHLMVMHPHTKYHWPISKDKNVMAWTRKYYLKNNYLTFRSKVKVSRRSLRYVTHRLMVMHPRTNYNWPI